jgi:protein O-mannosyl-transferase
MGMTGPGKSARPANRLFWAILVPLLLLTAAVYRPVGGHEFLLLDDVVYVAWNRTVAKGLTGEGVAYAFRNVSGRDYWNPLTTISHMIDVSLFGMDAGRHHRTNLILHLLNTATLFVVLGAMTGAVRRSGLVAALFALHPLHVESVAWIAERKDVLSTWFGFIALGAYLRYAQRPGKARAVVVTVFFSLGLLAKPMLVTLPLLFLLLDYWPLGRFWAPPGRDRRRALRSRLRELLAEKIPFLALACAAAAVTLWIHKTSGSLEHSTTLSPLLRSAYAVRNCLFYATKMLLPAKLQLFYSYPAETFDRAWQIGGAAVLFAGLTALSLRRLGNQPWAAVGWFWYLVTLAPVAGIIPQGVQSTADRYTYVPLIGLFLAIVWGTGEAAARWRTPRTVLTIVAMMALFAFAAATRQRVGYWRDTPTLLARDVAVNPGDLLARQRLREARATMVNPTRWGQR